MKVVEAVWIDAFSIDPWETIEGLSQKPYQIIRSIGFLTVSDKEKIVVSLSHDLESDQYSCSIVIPRQFLKSLKVLKNEKETARANSDIRRRHSRG